MSAVRVFLARVIAAWVAAGAAWLAAKYGFEIDEQVQAHITAGVLSVILGIGLSLYGPIHKLLNKYINPGDAASATLAGVEVGERDALKASGTSGFAGGKAYGGAQVDPSLVADSAVPKWTAAQVRAKDSQGGVL